MKINYMIDEFVGDIYFERPCVLREKFINICEKFEKGLDDFESNKKINNEKILMMNNFLKVFETNDFIKMSDFLLYEVTPFMKKLKLK